MVVTTRAGALLLAAYSASLVYMNANRYRRGALSKTNYERYASTPSKVAALIIEHDYEEEMERNSDEYLRVYSVENGDLTELGYFEGSWEFEEWLYSDLSFDEWRKNR